MSPSVPSAASAASDIRNSLLRALSPPALDRIRPLLTLVDLERRAILNPAGTAPQHVYFPEGGIVSFTLPLPDSGLVEFGIIGRDGVSSFLALRENQLSPVNSVVQIGGAQAYRIGSAELRQVAQEHRELHDLMVDYLHRFMSQMAFTAISNTRHSLTQRLARWLLMCHDRLDGNEIALTHDFLAMILGSQRTSVTSTLHVLEGQGAVYSKRGVVQVRNRRRLEECAGEAYDRSGVGNPK